MTVSSVKAPKTVGPNLMELTIRERAAAAWAKQAAEDRYKAERAALNLVQTIFGNVPVLFDSFVPESFAKRHLFDPCEIVTFEIEGLEFNYVAASQKRREHLALLDNCPCGRGPRFVGDVFKIADIGRFLSFDLEYVLQDVQCLSCKADAKAKAS